MRRLALVVAILISGCSGPGEVVETTGEAPAGASVGDVRFDRPTWAVGDWWTYRFDDGNETTWVVTEAGAGYVMDVDDEGLAFFDAAFADISTIGPLTADLDGLQNGTPVAFFQWPITSGAAWTLQWDGLTFDAVANVTDAGALIAAVAADGTTRSYTYDNASKWFGSIASHDANGTLQWRVELMGSGTDYGGEYVRYDILATNTLSFNGGPRNTMGVMDVPAEATDIWWRTDLACAAPPGQLTYALVPPGPNQAGLFEHLRCPDAIQHGGVIPAVAGTWRDASSSIGVTGSIQVIVRTLVTSTL